jgi:glutathione S-transferase
VLPRPDLREQLGIRYRRIPLLSIGRDVYADTRLIIERLEVLYPASAAHPGIAATTPEGAAIERLLVRYMTDGGVFRAGSGLLSPDLPALQDPRFLADRSDLLGAPGSFSAEAQRARRPEAAAEVRDALALLETTLLADGRAWLLLHNNNTEGGGPALADVEAVWLFRWLTLLPGALSDAVRAAHPKTFAWVARFEEALARRTAEVGEPVAVTGEAAARTIVASGFVEEGDVDEAEEYVHVAGLRKGDSVKLFPTDYGSTHKDEGRLVAATDKQIVIETQGTAGSVRLHAPRHGFKVQKADGSAKI